MKSPSVSHVIYPYESLVREAVEVTKMAQAVAIAFDYPS